MEEFKIWRIVEGKRLCFRLTEEEIEHIHSSLSEQDRKTHLIDLLYNLDEDDSCFRGKSREELINDPRFLSAVIGEWYHLNGHGGDTSENLCSAVEKVIQSMPWQISATKSVGASEEPNDDGLLELKVMIEGGIVHGVLKNQQIPVHVEIVDVDTDYEDYERLLAYRKSLCENPTFLECSFSSANFEAE